MKKKILLPKGSAYLCLKHKEAQLKGLSILKLLFHNVADKLMRRHVHL